jgi:hypothetical protein
MLTRIEPIVYKQAAIGSATWFITYFFIRRVLNPDFWDENKLQFEFRDAMFGCVAMFFMIVLNFALFKFYSLDDEEIKKVQKTFSQN